MLVATQHFLKKQWVVTLAGAEMNCTGSTSAFLVKKNICWLFLFMYNDNASAISMNIQLNSGAVMQFYILAFHVLVSHIFWQMFLLAECFVGTAKLK